MTNTQISGQIESLTYNNLKKLTYLRLGTRDSCISITSENIPSAEFIKPELKKIEFIQLDNLNDFEQWLQEAANFGHGVTLFIKDTNIISITMFPRVGELTVNGGV